MASVEKDGQGYRIRFIDHNRQRRAVRLGGMNKANVEKIARHIEELVSWRKSGLTLDSATAAWIGKVGDEIHEKLSKAGLIEQRVSTTLAKFLEEYIDGRTTLKPGTVKNLDQTRWNLIAFFGANTALRSFRPEQGKEFREWLLKDEQLAENTVRRRCGRARQFFTEAKKRGVADLNPFDGIPVTVKGNKAKTHFLTAEDSARVLEACIDQEWRAIFALCRWGGLRCPSEVLSLKWKHVLWDVKRLIVTSPKTAHHEGKETRVIPLFPEVERELSPLFFSPAGTEFCINRYRWKNQNLRTQFLRIIESAGLKPWAKPFQNLRATRDTELSEILPAHVVASWIGHTENVAREHYLHPNDAHFEKMTGGGAQAGAQHPRTPESKGVE